MKDFDFIKNKIENENITAPNSLSEENIKALVEGGAEPKNTIKLRSKKTFKAVVAMVACFAVFIISITSFNAFENKDVVKEIEPNSDSALITYNSYSEIESQIKRIEKDRMTEFECGLTMKVEGVDTDTADDSLSINHSVTNTQVEGVDEADIVKTDGKYIYRMSQDDTAIRIFEVNGAEVKKLGFARIDEKKHDYNYILEMYLTSDKLIAIGTFDEFNEKYVYSDTGTFVCVFNINDKENPTIEYSYEQSGSYVSSRMINDCLYLVTNHYAGKYSYIPTVNDEKISCDCIYGVPNIDEPSYVVVSAIDVKNQKANKVKSKAILGGASQVYCSTENLYVLSTNYRWYDMLKSNEKEKIDKVTSDIIKISLDETKLNVVATAQIEGRINNQYSMNERDGNFFVAATTETDNHEDVNTLYVLDEKLNNVSKVKNFAKNESIKAVRYIGNYAYVITYEQTDPLFVIDLSDIYNPQIKGSVKIDGFSTSLTPVDENTLLGVGNYVDDLVEDGIKFVLFDISNPEQPKVKSELSYQGYYSNAQYNIKAITMFDSKVAIPLYGNDENEAILLVEIKDGKLVESNRYSFGKYSNVLRVIRIGNYLYGITDNVSGVGVRAVKM